MTTDWPFSYSVPLLLHTVIVCSDLPPLANGTISYDYGFIDIRPVGAMANYSCIVGYTLNGESIRICQSDENWTDSAPTCEGEEKH